MLQSPVNLVLRIQLYLTVCCRYAAKLPASAARQGRGPANRRDVTLTEGRLKATTATAEEQAAIEKLMELMAQLEGKTIEDLYTPGSIVRVTKQEGKYHAAIDVPIDNSVPSSGAP